MRLEILKPDETKLHHFGSFPAIVISKRYSRRQSQTKGERPCYPTFEMAVRLSALIVSVLN